MSSDPRRSLCDAHHHHHDPSNPTVQTSPDRLFNINIPPLRRGFDLRRPVMSQARQDVIDLTEDTSSPPVAHTVPPAQRHSEASTTANRPPRYDRNIIDIDEPEENAVDLREESPEIQFLTSRPRSRSLSATRPLARRRPGLAPTTRSPGRRPQLAVRVAAGDRNPHQLASWTGALQNLQIPRPYHSNYNRAHEADDLAGFGGDFTVGGGFNLGDGLFQVPDNLNFLQAGFDYERPSRPQQQPRLPTYEAPPAPQDGFTRSPKEEDTLVCPHCDDELGVGDEEVKRQVWVVKACGHVRILEFLPSPVLMHLFQVYCGDCAINRSIKQSSLAGSSRRVKPWSKCVVDDCGKSVVNPKSVIQVYL